MNALAPINAAQLPRCLTNGSTRQGWVYCIRDDASGTVKIGFSKNPERRFRQIQTSFPFKLRLIATIPAVEAFEQFLHWSHASRRLTGEWFDDADGSVSNLFALTASEGF
ncbi:GIY-YIG nuclease family protein [Paracoccus yeei]|uniref:GIY-YIG nuclease family protein n=1 Tax=Paracoccus yeei TaxID=147645 RepID=UPI003BF857A1